MLILNRKDGERIAIQLGGVTVWVTVWDRTATSVCLGIEAPPAVIVDREEVHWRRKRGGKPNPSGDEAAPGGA